MSQKPELISRPARPGKRETKDSAMGALGILALLCYGVHGAYHVYQGNPENLLWACHLGAALIGVGLMVDSSWVNAVGTLFLCLGTPQWLLYLAAGGEFMPTSLATHVVALGIGLYAAYRYGVPRGTWWKALAGLVLLILLSRAITPMEANVNVAFTVQPGWESLFPSYPYYIALMVVTAGAYFWLIEKLIQRWLVTATEEEWG